MSEDLFALVPDHPRLAQREHIDSTLNANKAKFLVVKGFLNKQTVFAKFAAGDCKFATTVAKHVASVYGIDISDQTGRVDVSLNNFKLLVYDGYHLETIKDNSIDVVFSNQLIEHIHPEDTKLHFELVHRILKKGGTYVFSTPHALTGPNDVSMYFLDKPECFHLKEWTYVELKRMLKDLNYSKMYSYRCARGKRIRIPYLILETCEKVFSLFPKTYIRGFARLLISQITCAAFK